MAYANYLVKSPSGIYHFRFVFNLRQKRQQVKRSLGTRNRTYAQLLALEMALHCKRLIAKGLTQHMFDENAFDEYLRDSYLSVTAGSPLHRNITGENPETGEPELDKLDYGNPFTVEPKRVIAWVRTNLPEEFEQALASSQQREGLFYGHVLAQCHQLYGDYFTLIEDEKANLIAQERLSRARRATQMSVLGKELSVSTSTPPNSTSSIEAHPDSPATSERLSALAERFYASKKDDIRNKKDFEDLQRKVQRFIELLGDPPAFSLDEDMIDTAVKLAKELPREQGEASGKSALEMLELALPPRSLQTTNNQLTTVKEFIKWLSNRRKTKYDFSSLIKPYKIMKQQDSSLRRSWHIDELQNIFNSYVYRYDEDAIGKKHGNEKFGFSKFWVPLIGLFTGARLEEICSLRSANIVSIEGIWCFDMPEFDEDGNPIKKNEKSVRTFPIHQRLIEIGLVEYAQKRQKQGHLMLLDEKMKSGKWSHEFSKWFGRTFKARVGLPVGNNEVVFHSFRHNVVNEFVSTHIPEQSFSWITGHSTGGTALKTYAYQGRMIFPPNQLVDIVNKISYDKLDLSHISFDDFCSKYMQPRRKPRSKSKRNKAIAGE